MSAGDAEPSGQAFEMGRLVQGFATMQAAVSRIEGKLDSVATKSDIAEVRAIAQSGLDQANRANTRLDGMAASSSPWKQLGVAVLAAIILAGLGAMALVK